MWTHDVFEGDISMWTVVYVAQNKEELDKIYKALDDEGILIKTRGIGKSDDKAIYEVLVPQAEVEDASVVLTSIVY
jgi:hypothetical protein